MKKFLFATLTVAMSFTSSAFADASASDVKLNKYKAMLVVGQDEELPENSLTFNAQVFNDVLGWSNSKRNEFRQQAILWFSTRFGIPSDFGTPDPTTGISANSLGQLLIPLSCKGAYRVQSSDFKHIPAFSDKHPTIAELAEYTINFSVSGPPTYAGTFVSGGGSAQGEVSDTLAFGCYRIFFDKKRKHHTDVFMRSYYPGTRQSVAYPGRGQEWLQLFNKELGAGFGRLNVLVPGIPDVAGAWPTQIYNAWSFPASRVFSDLNSFNRSPFDND